MREQKQIIAHALPLTQRLKNEGAITLISIHGERGTAVSHEERSKPLMRINCLKRAKGANDPGWDYN